MITFEITKEKLSQLRHILQKSNQVLIKCTNECSYFITDFGEYYYTIKFETRVAKTTHAIVPTSVFNLVTVPGRLNISIEETTIVSFDEFNSKDGKYYEVWSTVSSTQPVIGSAIDTYTSVVESASITNSTIEMTEDLVSMVECCTVTGSPLQIENGVATAENDDIIIYQGIDNDAESLTLTGSSLKCLINFKNYKFICCVRNYIVACGEGYYLSIRQAISRNLRKIPERIKNPNLASYYAKTDFKFFSPIIENYSEKVDKDCICEIDLGGSNIASIKTTHIDYSIVLPLADARFNQSKRTSSKLRIDIRNLKSIKRLLSKTNIQELYVYDRVIRIKIRGINIIIRRSV